MATTWETRCCCLGPWCLLHPLQLPLGWVFGCRTQSEPTAMATGLPPSLGPPLSGASLWWEVLASGPWCYSSFRRLVRLMVAPEGTGGSWRWCQLGTNAVVPQSYCLCNRPKGRVDFGVLNNRGGGEDWELIIDLFTSMFINELNFHKGQGL